MTEPRGPAPTMEVVQTYLLAAAEEMGIVLTRTAYSPNIKERRDSSTAILDGDGQVVAQAAHIPMHLASMMGLGAALFREYPPETLRPGDMFVANDPYTGAGSHLNDITLIAPVFARGRLLALVANTAHHADVGGRVPGSESGDSRSIWEDGLRLPVARLLRRGRIEDGLWRTILLNSRTPDERIGDLRAQIAANRAGIRRVEDLAGAWGPDTLRSAMHGLLDYTERRLRDGLRRLPRGVHPAEGRTDDNGVAPEPVTVRLVLTVGDGELTLDFTGTDAQMPGAKNVPLVSLLATAYYVVKAAVDPDIPANAGYYRAIRVVAPRGSVLNPEPPAAVAARFTTCQVVAGIILQALAAAAPARVVAGSHGGSLAIYSGMDARRGAFFVDYEVYAGGAGARAGQDGHDAVANHMTNTSNLPIESLEREYPLRVERYELRPDSGGPGRFRGGLGAVRVVGPAGARANGGGRTSSERVEWSNAVSFPEDPDGLTIGGWGCDQHVPPRGLAGGSDGAPGAFEVLARDGTVVATVRATVSGLRLDLGQRLRVSTAGGGGIGDPLARDPDAVLADVHEGAVTPSHAQAAYGVIVHDGAVDQAATEMLRARRRERPSAGGSP